MATAARSRTAHARGTATEGEADAPAALTTEESLTEADVEAYVEARVEAAYQELRPERAEPQFWWDVAAIGPFQFTAAGGPLLPHSIIKVGEPAFVATIILLNDQEALAGGTNAAAVLSNFALPYEVRYQTGNLTTWSLGQANMQAVHTGLNLIPNQFFYIDVIGFIGTVPGLYEMNITSRLLGAAPPFVNAPQFAAYASNVFSLDADGLFGPTPQGPVRFQVYP
jgi:hypothetical protein